MGLPIKNNQPQQPRQQKIEQVISKSMVLRYYSLRQWHPSVIKRGKNTKSPITWRVLNDNIIELNGGLSSKPRLKKPEATAVVLASFTLHSATLLLTTLSRGDFSVWLTLGHP